MGIDQNFVSWVNGESTPPAFPWPKAGHSITAPAHTNSSQFGVLGNRIPSQFPPILFSIFSPGQRRVIRFSSFPLVNGGSTTGQRRVISGCPTDRFFLLSPTCLTLLPFSPGSTGQVNGTADQTQEPAQEPSERTHNSRPIPAQTRPIPALPHMHNNPGQFHYSRQFFPKKPGTIESTPIEPKNPSIPTIHANSPIPGKIEINSSMSGGRTDTFDEFSIFSCKITSSQNQKPSA